MEHRKADGQLRTEARESFLDNIARNLGRPRMSRPPERLREPDLATLYPKEANLSAEEGVERFVRGWRELGGVAERVTSVEDVKKHFTDLMLEQHVASVTLWDHPELEQMGLSEWLQQQGKKVVKPWKDGCKTGDLEEGHYKEMSSCDLGVTWADFAIAWTSTVVLSSGTGQARSVSLLPPVYVVLFKEEQVVSRMGEVWGRWRGTSGVSLPSSINLITGPSRSSDIENDLSIGVHGPGVTCAFVLKNHWEG